MSYVAIMIKRGESSEWIQKVYHYFKNKPFTCKAITKKIPDFRGSMLTAMHNSNVIKLLNGKRRATGISKKNPSIWVFTSEALCILKDYIKESKG